ncbi:MAG: hypothetical protein M1360_03875 [Candidatus Marsarchaeota archaeon]|jgi:hypothetical protein|nr:hypothetical protein [Candidatus Marsarchaeota archaeon]MCL5419049.1 hypothetical protein [Candidatus Marsarchaeota archaeon]
MILCERCKRETYRYETCNYCGRKVCYDCIKSSRRYHKTVRLVICKDCWGDMKKRRAFKNNSTEVLEAKAQAATA